MGMDGYKETKEGEAKTFFLPSLLEEKNWGIKEDWTENR